MRVSVAGPKRDPELLALIGDRPQTVVPRHLLLHGWDEFDDQGGDDAASVLDGVDALRGETGEAVLHRLELLG